MSSTISKHTVLTLALATVACQSALAQGGTNRYGGNRPVPPLAETKELINDDNLVPTMNRTQAMRLEAETGHVTPQVDAALEPTMRKKYGPQPSPHVVRRTHAKMRGPVVRLY